MTKSFPTAASWPEIGKLTLTGIKNGKRKKNLIDALSDIFKNGNPVQIEITPSDNTFTRNSKAEKHLLLLPLWLKVSNSPHFEPYAKTLFEYANVIAKADGFVTETEAKKLKRLFGTIHNPLNETVSGASTVSTPDKSGSLEEVMEELHSLTGLEAVKHEIVSLVNLSKFKRPEIPKD